MQQPVIHKLMYTYIITIITHNIPIPTMDTDAEVARRFYEELIDIQVLPVIDAKISARLLIHLTEYSLYQRFNLLSYLQLWSS